MSFDVERPLLKIVRRRKAGPEVLPIQPLIMNCGAAKVYPFFSQEKRRTTVCVSKTRLQKTLVCIDEFDIAQEADILNLVQQS